MLEIISSAPDVEAVAGLGPHPSPPVLNQNSEHGCCWSDVLLKIESEAVQADQVALLPSLDCQVPEACTASAALRRDDALSLLVVRRASETDDETKDEKKIAGFIPELPAAGLLESLKGTAPRIGSTKFESSHSEVTPSLPLVSPLPFPGSKPAGPTISVPDEPGTPVAPDVAAGLPAIEAGLASSIPEPPAAGLLESLKGTTSGTGSAEAGPMHSEPTTSPGIVSEHPFPDHSFSEPRSSDVSESRPPQPAGAMAASRLGEALASQIHSRFTSDASRDVLRFEADLDPPTLGRIRVELSWDSGRVLGRLVVFTEAAKQAIEHQLPALQHELNKIGIPAGQIDVTPQHNAGQEKNDRRDTWQDPSTSPARTRVRTRVATAKTLAQRVGRIDLWA